MNRESAGHSKAKCSSLNILHTQEHSVTTQVAFVSITETQIGSHDTMHIFVTFQASQIKTLILFMEGIK